VYTLKQVVAASYNCTDATSGIASCAGTVANGSNIDTASVGSKSFTVNAEDNAGNTASQTVNYEVAYNVCLLYDPNKAAKAGSTIPIKLQLCDANNNNVSSASIAVTALNSPGDSGKANPGDMFRYDPTLGGYIYNLSTKGLSSGTHTLNFSANGDPVTHSVTYQVK